MNLSLPVNFQESKHLSATERKKLNGENGFSLLEAMVSLLVLLAIMAGLLPVFMSWRLATVKNKIKTGAIAISQQTLDSLRQDKEVSTWPNTGTTQTSVEYDKRTYDTSVTYCQDSSFCDTKTRQVTLQISHNNDTIYTIDTVFTELE